jgi:ribosome-associated toxin RatA of RatAB toxin-antitoxin module
MSPAKPLLVLACLFSPLLLAATPPPEHPLLTPELLAELEKGEAVIAKSHEKGEEGNDAASASALGLIEKPAADVWTVLNDFEKQPEFMPRLEKVERYETTQPTIGLNHTLKVLWKRVNYHLLMEVDNAAMRQSWKLDDSKKNDIKTTIGTWTLLPWGDDRCIVVYDIEVNTGMAVPKFVSQMLLKQDLPSVVDALKQRVESGGTWKKD